MVSFRFLNVSEADRIPLFFPRSSVKRVLFRKQRQAFFSVDLHGMWNYAIGIFNFFLGIGSLLRSAVTRGLRYSPLPAPPFRISRRWDSRTRSSWPLAGRGGFVLVLRSKRWFHGGFFKEAQETLAARCCTSIFFLSPVIIIF